MSYINIGKRIKFVRKFRGLKQSELAIKIGLPNNENGRTRISQYEHGVRIPKKDIIEKLSNVLNINPSYLDNTNQSEILNFIYFLFDYDEINSINIQNKKGEFYINFKNDDFSTFFEEWLKIKEDLQKGSITINEYIEWKLNYQFERKK